MKRPSYKEVAKMKEIANGGFYNNGIIDQEQFEKFLSSIPRGFTRIIQNAKNNWKKISEYKDNSEEELIEKRKSTEKQLDCFQIYKQLLSMGIIADYYKMMNKTIDELNTMLKFAEDNPGKDFNKKNYIKSNPLRDIVIDPESKADYLKQDPDARGYRLEIFRMSLLDEIKIIDSVLKMKKAEQEKDNQESITEDENKINLVENEENLEDTPKLDQEESKTEEKQGENIEEFKDAMPELDEETSKTEEMEQEDKEQQYSGLGAIAELISLDGLAKMIDAIEDDHLVLLRKQEEIGQKIEEVLLQKKESIEKIGTQTVTAKEILQIIREQAGILNKLNEELTKISLIDNENREARDVLIKKMKSRMLRGEE